ncbi:hypothetical protein MKW92_035158 [Papaver armeniacum]|nr:hypothetical protein MKW92_035158 [Papaver armeniacum]
MASSDTQSSHDSPIEPETSSRGKTDIAWKYAREEKDPVTKKRSITCLVCMRKIMGGGINRLKKHLAGQRGEITPCKKVGPDVRYQMLESLKETSTKNRQREDLVVDDDPDQINFDELEAIATDVTIPIFESANRRNHDLPQARADENNGNAAGAWNDLDDNDDMELENDRMFERHDLNDVGYQDVGFEGSHFNLNDFPL